MQWCVFSISSSRQSRSRTSISWPTAILDMETLHKKWLLERDATLRVEPYHPKIVGFENSLKIRRKQASDIVESVAHISLPFPVETRIAQKSNLAWKDGTEKIVYVDLKAAVEGYSVNMDSEAFESL